MEEGGPQGAFLGFWRRLATVFGQPARPLVLLNDSPETSMISLRSSIDAATRHDVDPTPRSTALDLADAKAPSDSPSTCYARRETVSYGYAKDNAKDRRLDWIIFEWRRLRMISQNPWLWVNEYESPGWRLERFKEIGKGIYPIAEEPDAEARALGEHTVPEYSLTVRLYDDNLNKYVIEYHCKDFLESWDPRYVWRAPR
jgi:hypothetical protein